jgi:spore coat polysaccharide biosynthesis protein SpsF
MASPRRFKKVVAAITARMGGRLLTAKPMADLCGKPLLWHVINRVRRAAGVAEVAVATTQREEEQPLCAKAAEWKVACIRGPERDVLERLIQTVRATQADALVRVHGDAPFVPPELIDRLIDALETGNVDAARGGGAEQLTHGGAEAITGEALARFADLQIDPALRALGFSGVFTRPDAFRLKLVDEDPALRREGLRLTVDTRADLRLAQALYERLYREGVIVDLRRALALIDSDPALAELARRGAKRWTAGRGPRIVLWTDAGPTCGLSHLLRCLTLGVALQEHGLAERVWIAAPDRTDIVRERTLAEHLGLIRLPVDRKKEADALAAAVSENRILGVLADRPEGLSAEDVAALRSETRIPRVSGLDMRPAVIVLGAAGDGARKADRVILPSAHHDPADLVRIGWESGDRWRIGAEFAVLAAPFLRPTRMTEPAEEFRVLVTMGTSDLSGLTLPALAAVRAALPAAVIDLVVGPTNSRGPEIMAQVKGMGSAVQPYRDVRDMVALMDTVNLAVAAFGVTAYELAARGIPAILAIEDPSELGDCERFCRHGSALCLGLPGAIDAERLKRMVSDLAANAVVRATMSRRGRDLADGRGAERTANLVMETVRKVWGARVPAAVGKKE